MKRNAGYFSPNGVRVGFTPKLFEYQRWLLVERRAAELLLYLRPNLDTQQRRYDIISYLQRLITTHCSTCCQVFQVGSVPLKTYLPDGDIDLAAFTNNNCETLINEVRDLLHAQEKILDAQFRVQHVQYIQAEVKIVKFIVENFVVDISFNQLSGLCTLCFLDEVDNVIGHNHLFKRSVILIKAWCYYESQILGAYYRLMSTYALETLVIYIFHVYNKPFSGPVEVLFRFLEFFNKFDWDNYCISLWGPVHKECVPKMMRAEAPRGDREVLLLSETFLRSSISCYSVPRINENNNNVEERPFVFKCINIVDPLRPNNNLGRSISRGSGVRIKSAIANGEERIIRLLESAEENVIAEFDSFFKNTWNRSGKGYWIPSFHENNNSSSKHVNEIGTSFDAAPSSWSSKDHTNNNNNNNAAMVTDQGSHHHHSSSMNESGDSASNVIINNELSGVNMPCSNPDALPLYLLEQQINNLKLGNNNNDDNNNNNLQAQQEKSDNQGLLPGPINSNNNNVTPFSFPMAMNMESTLLVDVLEGDFASHWKNMQNARLSLDGNLQGPFCSSSSPVIPPLQSQLLLGNFPLLTCAGIVPNMMLPASGNMSQSHPLLPMMQNSGPNCDSVPFGFGEHPRHQVGTGTFIPDPESYKLRVKFQARRRNYDRPREGRFNYEYERTNSGGADYNYGNLVWKPVETKRYMNIGNHKEASSSSTAGTNSEEDFAHSSSNQPLSPNISGVNMKDSTSQ
ncbi:hypothetical protein S83_060367 [Arachis hypogaea]